MSPTHTVLAAIVLAGGLFTSAAEELNLSVLKERERLMRAAVKIATPAVVGIEYPDGSGSGSGVFVRKDGLLLTAAHVSGEAGKDVDVLLPDGERLKAKTLGAYRSLDAGMIKVIDEDREFPVVELGNSEALQQGEWCLAMGHSGGFIKERGAPVRLGRLLSTDIQGFLLTDSTLVGGDSGGALLDLKGRLIGIHSSIGFDLAENRHVPVQVFKEQWKTMEGGDVVGELYDWARRDWPFLGVEIDANESAGATVRSVVELSPAAKVGIRRGDRIIKLDGREIRNGAHFLRRLQRYEVDDQIDLIVVREDEGRLELKPRLRKRRDFLKPESE